MNIDRKDWQYLGAGASNVVFAYIGNEVILGGKVIRLRIEGARFSTQEIYSYILTSQFDELRPYILETTMVKIDKNSLMVFQKLLFETHLKRVKLDEDHALLLNNFLSDRINNYHIVELNKYYKFFIHKSSKEILFEFKPKWLTETSDKYLNCRNCATAKLKKQSFIYCHLKIFEKGGIDSFCFSITKELQRKMVCTDGIKDSMKLTIESNFGLLNTLKKLQNKIDIHNELCNLSSIDDVTNELQFNMTLRDVSLIFNLRKSTAYLIDVDKKPPEKWKDWKLKELKYRNYCAAGSEFNG